VPWWKLQRKPTLAKWSLAGAQAFFVNAASGGNVRDIGPGHDPVLNAITSKDFGARHEASAEPLGGIAGGGAGTPDGTFRSRGPTAVTASSSRQVFADPDHEYGAPR
jgi:hypothetical protein